MENNRYQNAFRNLQRPQSTITSILLQLIMIILQEILGLLYNVHYQ